jgi:hypothetical protein
MMLKILTRHEKPSPQMQVSFNINSPLRWKQEALSKFLKKSFHRRETTIRLCHKDKTRGQKTAQIKKEAARMQLLSWNKQKKLIIAFTREVE